MKNLIFTILFIIYVTLNSTASTFYSGKDIIISKPVLENIYLAGSTLTINSIVQGDLIAAGKLISVNDSIYEDVTIAGSEVLFNAFIGDDARIVGQNIKVLKDIGGDLIVAGGSVFIDRNVTVGGDLIVFGGEVEIHGTINGNVKLMGGKILFGGLIKGNVVMKANELSLSGTILGASELAAKDIQLEPGAKFHANVEYWQTKDDVNFTSHMANGLATLNADLRPDKGKEEWKYFGLGMVLFGILYFLAVLLILVVLVLVFPEIFSETGKRINHSFLRNFGYGALYFIGLPLIGLFCLVTIIGIPIGLVLILLYVLSLLFAYSVTSVVMAHGINIRYNKNWKKSRIILIAALCFIALKLITAIPFIGLLLFLLLAGMAYGTLIIPCMERKV